MHLTLKEFRIKELMCIEGIPSIFKKCFVLHYLLEVPFLKFWLGAVFGEDVSLHNLSLSLWSLGLWKLLVDCKIAISTSGLSNPKFFNYRIDQDKARFQK